MDVNLYCLACDQNLMIGTKIDVFCPVSKMRLIFLSNIFLLNVVYVIYVIKYINLVLRIIYMIISSMDVV